MKCVAMGWMFALGLFFLTGPARAGDIACFDWSCNETTHACDFNAACSTIAHNLFRYTWTFGDGTSANTGVPTISHSYSIPYPSVTLTLIFLNSSSVSTSNCGIVVWNSVGPAQPTSGTCY